MRVVAKIANYCIVIEVCSVCVAEVKPRTPGETMESVVLSVASDLPRGDVCPSLISLPPQMTTN